MSEKNLPWLKTPKMTFYLFHLARGSRDMAKSSLGALTKFMGEFDNVIGVRNITLYFEFPRT